MFHDDWEINGDGTGDPRQLMFEPARKALEICDRYGARYTFFAEVMQQFAMLNSPDPQHREWAAEWETILQNAVTRGHDVQLHVHPQWVGATVANGRWKLDFSKWSIARLPEEEVLGLVQAGKEYLESLLQPIAADYQVVAFRAGGWMAQPSDALVRALRRSGIKVDCSVVPGKRVRYATDWSTDYGNVPSRLFPWWVTEHDVARCGTRETGVVELPSYAEEFRLPLPVHLLRGNVRSALHYWRVYRGKSRQRWVREYAPQRQGPSVPRRGLLDRIIAPRSTYCSFGYMHHRSLMRMVGDARRYATEASMTDAPLVMLTHSKSFFAFSNFEALLRRLSTEPGVRFCRTKDYVDQLLSGAVAGLPLSASSIEASPAPHS